jgi:hypothetical protein
MKPKDLEKRLAVAYDAGKFDGYSEGSEDTHRAWCKVVQQVKGIGPKRYKALLVAIQVEAQRRLEELNMAPTELSQLVKEELQDGLRPAQPEVSQDLQGS